MIWYNDINDFKIMIIMIIIIIVVVIIGMITMAPVDIILFFNHIFDRNNRRIVRNYKEKLFCKTDWVRQSGMKSSLQEQKNCCQVMRDRTSAEVTFQTFIYDWLQK